MLGDQARAANAFGAALKALDAERDEGSRPDYGSRLRDAAAILALVAESELGGAAQGDAIARAGAVLEAARSGRSFLSTQEMNWMTLADRRPCRAREPRPVQRRRPNCEGRALPALERSGAVLPVLRHRQCRPGPGAARRVGLRRTNRAGPSSRARLCGRTVVRQARRNDSSMFCRTWRRTSGLLWPSR